MSKKDIKIEEKKKYKKVKKHWFTLVELIVVITILAILWSIAFVSFNWYAASARDWTRISDMRNLSKWLVLYFTKVWKYPTPENFSTITASGTIIRYQWYAWLRVLDTSWIWNINQWSSRDPKSWEFYTYTTDGGNLQYSIAWYFETWDFFSFNSVIPQANASYTWWIVKMIWAWLWVLCDWVKPIHELYASGITIDIINTWNTYTLKYWFNDEFIWTGAVLYSAYYNRDRYLLTNKDLAKYDDWLVWYRDMETTVLSWSMLVMKDFSKNWNHLSCYDLWARLNNWTLVSCWTSWPVINKWKMEFDGVDDYIRLNKSVYTPSMTMILKVKPKILDNDRHWFIGYQDWWGWRPFNLRNTRNDTIAWWWFHRDMRQASNTSVRCTWEKNFSYDKNSSTDTEFHVAYRRKPPYVDLIINWANFISQTCTFTDYHMSNWLRIWKIDNNFKWTIDEVRIYNRALTDAEISALYASTNYQSRISVQ